MNPRVYFAIHCIIGIASLAILGYAFSQPLATLSIGDNNMQATDDIYITQECISESVNGKIVKSQCDNVTPFFNPQMQAIMGIVIALMICIFLEFIGMNFGNAVSNVFGMLVLFISIALIVFVATLASYSRAGNTFKLTNTSIGVLVVASLLILYEICCNKLVHLAVLTPYRLISSAGKKA